MFSEGNYLLLNKITVFKKDFAKFFSLFYHVLICFAIVYFIFHFQMMNFYHISRLFTKVYQILKQNSRKKNSTTVNGDVSFFLTNTMKLSLLGKPFLSFFLIILLSHLLLLSSILNRIQ